MMLKRAVTHFGALRRLDTIDVPAVQAWVNALADGKLTAGRRLSPGSQRHHLNALSSLYRRALAEEVAARNPAAALLDKPSGADRDEADWLEVPDAALLLEAARTLPPNTNGGPRSTFPYAYPLVATFLLTGGRQREVRGLELDDVSFDAGTVTSRPNRWRRLKIPGSHRTVPLWPQLREILQPYVGQRVIDRGGTLVFPATGPGGAEQMIADFRKLLDVVAKRAGWQAGEIRSKRFRHTYISARIQTTDGGAPVSVFTVAREVGHSSTAMIEKVYGHLGARRHRSPVVEYRAEQHASILGDRLTALARPRGGKTVPATVPEPAEPAA